MEPQRATLEHLRIDRRAPPKGRSFGWLVPVLIAAAVVGAAAYWWTHRGTALEVQTIVVQQPQSLGGSKAVLNAAGYVTARRAATVSSKVTGKVLEMLVEEGMKVEAE